MSDFGKECAKEWREIRDNYGASPKNVDKSVREQIITDMNKNIERHENTPTPKAWPMPQRLHWACCVRCGAPLPGENYPCGSCGLTKEQSYGNVDPGC